MRLSELKPEKERIEYELRKIGVDPYALSMRDKGVSAVYKLYSLTPGQGNIIKQEALASGIDAAVCRGCINCTVDATDVLLLGSRRGLRILSERLLKQPFGLAEAGRRISEQLNKTSIKRLIHRSGEISLDKTLLMGIINLTPDSFSDGGVYLDPDNLNKRIEEFINYDVEIADIGGESSRPGAEQVSAEEEIERILSPLLKLKEAGMTVSVDTVKSSVAAKALENGADIINDISGFNYDPDLAGVCAEHGAAVCLMHMKGEPGTMQDNPSYDNLLDEVKSSLEVSIETALKAGISEESIILDPGFGFGKTIEHNYALLKYIGEFKSWGLPLLAGVSRKSMIGRVVKGESRLAGTLAAETAAVLGGADIIRAHDIPETRDMLTVADMIKGAEANA
ncbi:dihydropteroate synthase [Limisalsivibrio acetivorans]|uniref:dihydropteroate synthase n=1 Tax=Limisalsivibrio acetivorans TaxID=1304888 RepID=UPI0003B49271|nr:dihydropteroate synthase [Limisalsivibrio acetivorans]